MSILCLKLSINAFNFFLLKIKKQTLNGLTNEQYLMWGSCFFFQIIYGSMW